jgi:hypothetical protein
VMALGSEVDGRWEGEASVCGESAAPFDFHGVGWCDERVDVDTLAKVGGLVLRCKNSLYREKQFGPRFVCDPRPKSIRVNSRCRT